MNRGHIIRWHCTAACTRPPLFRQPGEQVIRKIDASDTPTKNYRSVMKGVFQEELQNSLQDYKLKKLSNSETKKNFNQSYLQDCERSKQQVENSLLHRQQYYDRIQQVQQDRAGKFIDSNKLHDRKVKEFVEGNLDPQCFHHLQEKYDQAKSSYKANYLHTLSEQKIQKEQRKETERINKENEQSRRFQIMEHLQRLSSLQRQSQQEEKEVYRRELDQLVKDKRSMSKDNKSCFYQPHARHNPITNPIDGHVDNPYFVKKLGNRLRL